MGLGAGSWRELGGHQRGAERRRLLHASWARGEGAWCLSSSRELWWVSGRVTGLRNVTADGCDGLPNEAEASLSEAFRTNKHRTSLKAEWQDDEHMGDDLPRIICQSAGSGAAPSAATKMPPSPPAPCFHLPTRGPLPLPHLPCQTHSTPSSVLSLLTANEMHTNTRPHTSSGF